MAAKKPVGANKKEANNKINKPENKTVKKPIKTTVKKKQTKKKINRNKPSNKKVVEVKKKYITHTGEKLSTLQGKFVDLYIELGNQRQAVIQAGYKVKDPDRQANMLLRIPKIADEVNYRLAKMHQDSIARSEEILEYYTKVMRGEINDQFGLEAPLSERTKAASELAKRLIDIPNKLEANLSKAGMTGQATVTIALNWDGMEDNDNAGEEEDKQKEE